MVHLSANHFNLVENLLKVVNTAVDGEGDQPDPAVAETENTEDTESTETGKNVTVEGETGGDEDLQPENLEGGDPPGKKNIIFILGGLTNQDSSLLTHALIMLNFQPS